jgi:hypothetical protein
MVLGAGIVAVARGVQGATAGPFDPVNAAIALVGLFATLYGVVLARRADRRMATSVPDAAEPYGLAVDGAELSAELPQRQVTLVELRALLISRRLSNTAIDVVWRELVRRARALGAVWLVGAVGVALPSLRRVSGRITRGY